jgi:hypothetical protein
MASHIGRRKSLATLGGAVAAWPLAARGQAAMPVIGFHREMPIKRGFFPLCREACGEEKSAARPIGSK